MTVCRILMFSTRTGELTLVLGALSSQKLQRIIIDASHIDQKKRSILDMKETQVPLVQLLTRQDLKSRYGAAQNRIDLIFY